MFKTKEEVIIIQAEAKEPIPTRTVFWSHDKGTAKMLFKLRKDGTSQSLAEGTIVPVLLKFNSETAEGGIGRHVYHAVIEDAVNGIVSIILEDNILGYQGRVDGSIYIELPDSRSLDTAGRFTFHIKRSPIDEDVPELEDYYWQGFGEIMEQYHESIAEIKLEAKTTLDSLTADVTTAKTKVTQLEQSIATANTNLNARIDEISKKIDDNDVFTKAESSANVIYQINGDEYANVKKEFLVNGTEGMGSRDANGTLVPFSDEDYTNMVTDEGIVRSETLVSGRGAEIEIIFNVLQILEVKYPYLFKNMTTSQKRTKYLSVVKNVSVTATARGGGLLNGSEKTVSKIYMLATNGFWWGMAASTNSSTEFISKQLDFATSWISQITSSGEYKLRVCSKLNSSTQETGAVSDGTVPAWIELKDIRLIVELEVSANEIIKEEIAANHVENLATQTEATNATDNAKAMTPLRTKQLLDSKLLNMVYPIGSIYMSVNSATPATLFGGTWERFSKGRVLVGVDESDTVLATSGKQGGSTNPLTAHTHVTQLTTYRVTSGTGSGSVNNLGRATDLGDKMTGEFGATSSAGDNTDHNNWQPFTTVYMWKRTA